MSIKSDRWIVEQATKGMIEPFEAGQIRTNASGGKVISYGTSSYGYDVRCANPVSYTHLTLPTTA